MTRIFLTIACVAVAVACGATPSAARRALAPNGPSLNGASAPAPLQVVAVELPAE